MELRTASRPDRSRSTAIRTVIVDRSPLVRMGLKHILTETRFRNCTEYSDLRDLPVNAIRDDQPGLVLIGIRHATVWDLSPIEDLKRAHCRLLVVVLAEGSSREDFLTAMDAGADGYIDRDNIGTDTLLQTLDLIMSRKAVITLALMRAMNDRVRERPVTESIVDMNGAIDVCQPALSQPAPNGENGCGIAFSKREQVILSHLMRGAPNKQIARELEVAEATVKVHVKALLRKIRVQNRTQAAMWAIGNGFNIISTAIFVLS
jgi:two-component system nitrate/nitrite response regulator NarL